MGLNLKKKLAAAARAFLRKQQRIMLAARQIPRPPGWRGWIHGNNLELESRISFVTANTCRHISISYISRINMSFKISRHDLFEFLMERSSEAWPIRYEHVDCYVRTALGENISDDAWKLVREKIHNHCGTVQKRWEECNRKRERFLKKYGVWLKQIITLTVPSIFSGIRQSI